jgi:hypothetical protein
MIYSSGTQSALAQQKKTLAQIADGSFCVNLPSDFGALPVPTGWQICDRTAIALRLNHVEAHEDTFVGVGPEPARRAAIFWLVSLPRSSLILHAGTDSMRMIEGDWVLFDDAVMHSVYSTKIWRGCSFQVSAGAGASAQRMPSRCTD